VKKEEMSEGRREKKEAKREARRASGRQGLMRVVPALGTTRTPTVDA
jgi:hypothetical protein